MVDTAEKREFPDSKLKPPVDTVEAERQLELIISNARKILRAYPTLYDCAYSRGQYGTSGGKGSGSGAERDVGLMLGSTRRIREKLMQSCDHFGQALSKIAGALSASDEALRLIDAAHPLTIEVHDRTRERTIEKKEQLDIHERIVSKLKAEIERDEQAERARLARIESSKKVRAS